MPNFSLIGKRMGMGAPKIQTLVARWWMRFTAFFCWLIISVLSSDYCFDVVGTQREGF